MGMNIACGNTKNDARNSLSGEVDGSGIGTSGSADGELVADAGVEGGLFYKALLVIEEKFIWSMV